MLKIHPLTVAAALCAAGPVFAQSSVTLYGRLNLTIESQEFDRQERQTNMVDNGSRIGLRGSEDLGNGMRAGFVLEHGFDADTGAAASDTAFWNRESEVNLSGSLGMIRMGGFTSEAYYATADYISLHNHDTGSSADALYADVRGFASSDKVGYMSPSFNGFVFHAAVNAIDAGSAETDRTYEVAATYDAGALHLGAGYQKSGDVNQVAIRGLYEMGNFALGGYYQRDENVFALGTRNSYRVAARYTLGASELHANIGWADDYEDFVDSGAHQVTLAYNYNLSKRSKAYAFVTRLGDDNDLRVYGGTREAFGVGVRHNF